MFTLQDAIGLAVWGHRNQTDQAGLPYIDHPLRVLRSVQARGGGPEVQIAAVLHDLTEDQPFTPDMLLQLGIPEAAVELVKLVDRDYSEKLFAHESVGWGISYTSPNYKDKRDAFYYANIRKNPDALLLKECDIADNTLEWRLSYLSESRQEHLRNKYAKARKLLQD